MFNASEARKATQEAIERRLEEKLSELIQKACENGDNCIMVELSKTEEKILKEAGYKVQACGPSYKISW